MNRAPVVAEKAAVLWPLLMVAALAIAAYVNAIGNAFVLDDVSIVVENPMVRGIDLHAIFTSPYWAHDAATPAADPTLYRPLTILSLALDRSLWGPDAAAFHAVNIALHAATASLVFLLALEVTGVVPGAFLAGAVFAVHPVHTEAVTGIVGRADVLATLFFTLAFLILRRRSRFSGERVLPALLWSLGGALVWLAGLLSKEVAATLPLLLAVDDWLHRDELPRDRARAMRSLIIRYAPMAAVAVVYFVLRQNAIEGPAHTWPGFADTSGFERVLTASRVLMENVLLFIYPRTLVADYWVTDVPIATTLLEPFVILSLLLWMTIAVVLFRYGKQNTAIVFGVAWFFITIAPVSNVFFPIGVARAERLLYLPSVGLCFLTATAALYVSRRVSSKLVQRTAFAAVVLALMWRTARRNEDWKDSFTLASATLATSPSSPLMNDIAAGEYMKRGEASRAMTLLRTAVQQAPNLSFLRSHLGATYYALQMPDDAIAEYKEAIRLNPRDVDALNNLGIAYMDRRQDDEAIAAFTSAIEVRPTFADAYLNLGTLHLVRGRLKEAEASFLETVRLNRGSAEAHNNLGLTFARMGDTDQAARHYREALRLNPGFEKARANLTALEKAQRR